MGPFLDTSGFLGRVCLRGRGALLLLLPLPSPPPSPLRRLLLPAQNNQRQRAAGPREVLHPLCRIASVAVPTAFAATAAAYAMRLKEIA
jgi:hypothetical protein